MSDVSAFITWYVAVSAAGLAALPLGFRFFRALPDRGYTLARPLGLLASGYVFWLLGSLGFLRNEAASVWIAAGLVLGAGLAWLGRAGWAELRAWLSAQRGLVLGVELVFLAAFAIWAWVRAHNPEIAGTEKPMEFMFINAILRSPAFPPTDAWLAGHAISYYYFGYLLIAALTQVTGVPSAVAFNLGIALLFALTATGALGVTLNMIALSRTGGAARAADSGRPAPPLLTAFWPALLAPLMIVAAGNFYGVLRIAHANGWARDLQVPAVYYDFGAVDAGQAPGVKAGLVNVYTWLDLKQMNTVPAPADGSLTLDPGFWWWFSGARVTHDRNLVGQETEAITEMPAFSFILGDMHPHVLGLPFVFLALAVALHWLTWAHDLAPELGPGRWELGLPLGALAPDLALSGLVLGGLSFLNTWDFPIYLFVAAAALAAGLGARHGWAALVRRWPLVAAFAGALAVAGLGLYLPFYLTLQSQAGGLLPNLIYPTRFQQMVVLFSHVLLGVALFVGWLAVRERAVFDRPAAAWAGGGLLLGLIALAGGMALFASLNPDLSGFVLQFLAPLSVGEAFGLTLQRRLVDSLAALIPAAVIAGCVGLGVGVMRRVSAGGERPAALAQPAPLFALVLALTGALLVLGPEFVYLRDNFGTRMNTIFKFYFQAWVLWGLAGAFGLWWMAQWARPRVWQTASAALSTAIALSLVYTFTATLSKTGQFANTPSLDGLAYFVQVYPNEWQAITWLKANVTGSPVIAEAVGGSYSEYGRISMATGLPTVMGWDGHESQWRGRYYEQVAARPGDIAQLYQARDAETAAQILTAYDIDYVVVSDFERRRYNPVADRKFAALMRPVFEAGDLIIYQRLTGAP